MTEKRIFKMTKKLMVGSVPVGGGTPVLRRSVYQSAAAAAGRNHAGGSG